MMRNIKVISFSGGKDSVAMLIYLINNKIPFDEIVYVRDFFPYPKFIMDYYIRYIEKSLNVKIAKIELDYKEEVKKNKIYPSGFAPYCSRLKAELCMKYVEQKYHRTRKNKIMITFFIGIRQDESENRKSYEKEGFWYWNRRFKGRDYKTIYPIFEFSEQDVFDYLKENRIMVNPLYSMLKINRLGCALCRNSNKRSKKTYFKIFPDDFKDFVEFEQEIQKKFPKKKIKMFPDNSITALQKEFESQFTLDTYFNSALIEKNPYLYPIIEDDFEKLKAEEKVDRFLEILKIKMPNSFYDLPKKEKEQILNKLFPKFIKKLSLTKKQVLLYIVESIMQGRKTLLIQRRMETSLDLLRDKNVIAFLEVQKKEIIRKNNLPSNYFEEIYPREINKLNATIKMLENRGFFNKNQ